MALQKGLDNAPCSPMSGTALGVGISLTRVPENLVFQGSEPGVRGSSLYVPESTWPGSWTRQWPALTTIGAEQLIDHKD